MRAPLKQTDPGMGSPTAVAGMQIQDNLIGSFKQTLKIDTSLSRLFRHMFGFRDDLIQASPRIPPNSTRFSTTSSDRRP